MTENKIKGQTLIFVAIIGLVGTIFTSSITSYFTSERRVGAIEGDIKVLKNEDTNIGKRFDIFEKNINNRFDSFEGVVLEAIRVSKK